MASNHENLDIEVVLGEQLLQSVVLGCPRRPINVVNPEVLGAR
jgi:hypothetical protein